jgi:drug/metabolite transporter (DMT)-like permease
VTAAAALLLAILIWASNSIMVKVLLREIEPLTLTWLRFLLASIVYLPYAAATPGGGGPATRRASGRS